VDTAACQEGSLSIIDRPSRIDHVVPIVFCHRKLTCLILGGKGSAERCIFELLWLLLRSPAYTRRMTPHLSVSQLLNKAELLEKTAAIQVGYRHHAREELNGWVPGFVKSLSILAKANHVK
jgi:hypothetical protein